jgi:hypothetical protein
MAVLLKGALIEYGNDLIGPIPNVVIFQFNPESLNRTFVLPQRPTGTNERELNQAGDAVGEKISLTAHFSALDMLGEDKALAKAFGIGPQLAALEKLVVPPPEGGGLLGQALDAIGDALGLGGGAADGPVQPIPRQSLPRTLFIWGLTRVQPVRVTSMRIAEVEYDNLLNPIRAEVEMEIEVLPIDPFSDDVLAIGASQYTQLAKDVQAVANLANTAEQIVELIPL